MPLSSAPAALMATLVLLGYAGLCLATWHRHRGRWQSGAMLETRMTPLLLAYASQSGEARRIAHQSAALLAVAGEAVTPRPLNEVAPEELAACRRALFVVSTYGQGEPPDNAALFARRCLNGNETADVSGLRFGVLALGDRRYSRFCGFGERLHRELAARGARPVQALIRVDRGDRDALRHWFEALGNETGDRPGAADSPSFAQWRLRLRQRLNPGSAAAPVCRLCLEPADKAARNVSWQAGDILRVLPGDDAGSDHWREYSIASLPGDGMLELVVRERRRDDGSPGRCSSWLTGGLPQGGRLRAAPRPNPAFHPPHPDAPMILVGSGTGIAGLRAHLKARVACGAGDNWLLFGERTAAHDALFDSELRGWLDSGHLRRLDRAYSRDGGGPRYVQHALRDATPELHRWVARGACIYVCGSRERMAPGVDRVLRATLGQPRVDQLLEQNRYRRDVY